MPGEEYYERNYGGNKLAIDWKDILPLAPHQLGDAAASHNVQQTVPDADC